MTSGQLRQKIGRRVQFPCVYQVPPSDSGSHSQIIRLSTVYRSPLKWLSQVYILLSIYRIRESGANRRRRHLEGSIYVGIPVPAKLGIKPCVKSYPRRKLLTSVRSYLKLACIHAVPSANCLADGKIDRKS